jgi:phenylacetate-CoA ligase
MSTQVTERDAGEQAWLQELVSGATARLPFYRDLLAGRDTSSLALLPSFDKHMTAGYGRFPLSAGGAAGAYRVIATSGTTGDRVFFAFDREDWDQVGTWMQQIARMVGLRSGDVLLNTHCYGLWIGGPALDLLADRAGACIVPVGPASPTLVLQILADGTGTAICATPSYLRRLVEAADETGFDLRSTGLRLGFIGAENAEPSLRRKLLSRLPDGFRWVELYGLTETTGPSVAFAPDPMVSGLTLNKRDFLVEVLDLHADVPATPGTVGELTITTRRAHCRTPLIRYRTRDLVRVLDGDPAAPTRISSILGRADDSLKIGGVLVYPSAVAEILSEVLPPTAEWRAIVRRHDQDDHLLLEAEAEPVLCRAVEHAFQERLGLGITVSSVDGGTLTRSREKTQRTLIESTTKDRG